jgi:hypothetical protein
VNSTTNAPATISVIVRVVDNAPLVNLSWFFCNAPTPDLRMLSSEFGSTCNGPSVSQFLALSMLRVTSLIRSGNPSMNCVTTNAKIPPTIAIPTSRIRNTAPPRGMRCRSSQSTPGSSSAVPISASATGTKITSICLNIHSTASMAAKMKSSRHDQAAPLRTISGTAVSSGAGMAVA